jgi:hypothetical protein
MKNRAVLERAGPALVIAMVVSLSLPDGAIAAEAECGVTDSGIPDGVIAPIDIAHMRNSLADVGLGIAGTYYGEAFANTGGLKRRAAYDGVLELDLAR